MQSGQRKGQSVAARTLHVRRVPGLARIHSLVAGAGGVAYVCGALEACPLGAIMLGRDAALQLGEGLEDLDLVAKTLAGEVRYFETLMRRHNQTVFRVARTIVLDDDEAEDVMQDAYLKAFAALARFEGRASFKTWLTRIAVNAAFARLRRRHPERVSFDPVAAPSTEDALDETPEGASHRAEVGRIIEGAVNRLPESLRIAFVLFEVEGMSTAEAALAIGITEANLKVRTHRARATLRTVLERHLGGGAPAIFNFHLVRCDRLVSAVLARIGLHVEETTTRGPGESLAPPS